MDDNSLQRVINKYFPYLLEIRKRLLFLVVIFIISSVIGFIYYENIIRWALTIFHLTGVNIVFTSPFQYMEIALNCAILIGIFVTFPFILHQFFAFLKPGLGNKEYRTLVSFIPLVIILFLIGFGFGLLIMRWVVILFYQQSLNLQIGNFIDISRFLSITLLTSALLGLAYEFPIVLTALMRFKVITYQMLAKNRLIAHCILIVFVLLMPPPDILSDILLYAPLAFLFELTLILNRVILKSHLITKGGDQ